MKRIRVSTYQQLVLSYEVLDTNQDRKVTTKVFLKAIMIADNFYSQARQASVEIVILIDILSQLQPNKHIK